MNGLTYHVNQNYDVRLLSVEVENFKNIRYGKINIEKEEKIKNEDASVIGIYGQNGSGKSSFVLAMEIFDGLVSGESIKTLLNDVIHKEENECVLKFSLRVDSKITRESVVDYHVKIVRDVDNENEFIIARESLHAKRRYDNSWNRKKLIFEVDYLNDVTIKPLTLWNSLKKMNTKIAVSYEVAKELSKSEKRSMLFSVDFLRLVNNDTDLMKEDKEIVDLYILIRELSEYCIASFMTVNNTYSGYVNANFYLPILYKLSDDIRPSKGEIFLDLSEPTTVSEASFATVKYVLEQMNIVLKKIIPGLELIVKEYGGRVLDDGSDGIHFELMSKKKTVVIPLRSESDGIKKIIFLLSYMIYMYNNTSCCLVVDELDASIFEYLLGEIIDVLGTSGKGQLIFTSHNLRPLEVLKPKSVYFTTVNEDNRFIQFSNIKASHNLRNQYFRNIVVGGQKEELYDETDSYEISYAFRKAGELNG